MVSARLASRGDIGQCQSSDKDAQHGAPNDLLLTPLELIDKIVVTVPPPGHRHRYDGVLAPNAPLRAAVTALVLVAVIAPSPPPADAAEAKEEPCHRAVSR